jgi:hypothetical protein
MSIFVQSSNKLLCCINSQILHVFTVKNSAFYEEFHQPPEQKAQNQTMSDGKLTIFRQPGCLVLRQLVDYFNSVQL